LKSWWGTERNLLNRNQFLGRDKPIPWGKNRDIPLFKVLTLARGREKNRYWDLFRIAVKEVGIRAEARKGGTPSYHCQHTLKLQAFGKEGKTIRGH